MDKRCMDNHKNVQMPGVLIDGKMFGRIDKQMDIDGFMD